MVQISQFAGAGDVFKRDPGDVAILENITGGIRNIQTQDLAAELAAPGISDEARQEALIRLQTINPQAAQSIEGTLLRGDARALDQQQREADKAFKLATFFDSIKDPQLQSVAIRKEARRVQSTGDTDGAQQLLDLANQTPAERRIAITKQIITAGDTKTVTKFAQDQAAQTRLQQRELTTTSIPDDKPLAEVPTAPLKPEEPVDESGITFVDSKRIKGKPKDEKLLFKIPSGFQLLDPNDQTKGLTPIPGGPKDNFSGDVAAKTQMLRTAREAAKGINDLVFDKDGSVNRTNIVNAQFNTPFTDGRELRTKLEFGIQAITRLETGAAMPPSEVENTRTRFMPQFGDTKEIIELKLEMFNDFINGTLKLLDPSGRLNAERFNTELEIRTKSKEMSDEDLLKGF